jgi:hypothetical protein
MANIEHIPDEVFRRIVSRLSIQDGFGVLPRVSVRYRDMVNTLPRPARHIITTILAKLKAAAAAEGRVVLVVIDFGALKNMESTHKGIHPLAVRWRELGEDHNSRLSIDGRVSLLGPMWYDCSMVINQDGSVTHVADEAAIVSAYEERVHGLFQGPLIHVDGLSAVQNVMVPYDIIRALKCDGDLRFSGACDVSLRMVERGSSVLPEICVLLRSMRPTLA